MSVRRFPHALAAFGTIVVCLLQAEPPSRPPFPTPFDTQALKTPLTPPAESARMFAAPPGFQVSVFAAEPSVQQPIGIALDGRGRLWVAENYTYAERGVKVDKRLRDRVVILEDTDHDGRFDKRTVFWDRGQVLGSVEMGFGGVWVMCSPRLLFIPDRNGDDIPDGEPVVMLEGFEEEIVHHHLANGLRWGPDGWLYGRRGNSNTCYVGPPGAPLERRVVMGGGIWRFHPTRHIFEAVAIGTTNPWGHDWDQHGELFFTNTVIGHLWHAVPGAHFQRFYGEDPNPFTYILMPQTADHYHWDAFKSWADSRNQTDLTNSLGGGHAHCGCMIYLGDNWPEEYRNREYTLNLHGRRINVESLERQGAAYVGRRVGDIFKTRDPWFRGIDLMYGPDGGVFVADWCDLDECHESDGVHRNSGRIFKITHGQPKAPSVRDVAALTNSELVKLQLHRNEWFPRQARRVLQEREASGQDMATTRDELSRLFIEQADPAHKLRAIWCLNAIGALSEPWLIDQLKHPNEHVRAWAIRFMVDSCEPSRVGIEALARLARQERSGLVHLYFASALQRLPFAARWPIAQGIVDRKEFAADPYLPLMTWYGVEAATPIHQREAVDLARSSTFPLIRQFVARRLTTEMEKNPRGVNGLLTWLGADTDEEAKAAVLTGMTEALQGRRKVPAPEAWAKVGPKLVQANQAPIRPLAEELAVVFGDGRAVEQLRRVAQSKEASPEARRNALRVLVQSRAEGTPALLQKLLNERELGPAVIRGLAAFDAPDTPKILVAGYGRMFAPGKIEAIETLSARPAWAKELLAAVRSGKIRKSEVPVFQIRQMQSFKEPSIDKALAELWPELKHTSKQKGEVIDRYRSELTPSRLAGADVADGRAIFQRVCASCHRLHGEGGQVGPDLTGSDRKNLTYLLENIVDPSAVVSKDFRLATVALKDGRVLSGVLGPKAGRTQPLQTPTMRLVIDEADIEDVSHSDLSLMPEGLLEALPPNQARDLIGYLMAERASDRSPR